MLGKLIHETPWSHDAWRGLSLHGPSYAWQFAANAWLLDWHHKPDILGPHKSASCVGGRLKMPCMWYLNAWSAWSAWGLTWHMLRCGSCHISHSCKVYWDHDLQGPEKSQKIEILRVVHQFSISSFKPPRTYATNNVFFLTCLFWQVPGSETGNFSLEFLCKELKELTRHQLGAVIQCHSVGLAVYWRLYISMLTKAGAWLHLWLLDVELFMGNHVKARQCFHRSLSCSSVNQSPLCFSIHSFGNITMDAPIELQWITSLSIHCVQQSEFHFINLMLGFFRFLKSHLS